MILGSSIILFFQIQNYYRYEFIDFLNIKISDYYTVFGNPFINYTIERFYIFWEIIPNYSLSFFHALFDSLPDPTFPFFDYLLGEHSRVSTAFKGGDYGLKRNCCLLWYFDFFNNHCFIHSNDFTWTEILLFRQPPI